MRTGASTGNTYGLIQAANTGDTVGTSLVLNQFGGNVGIGTTSPQTKLHVGSGTMSTSALAGISIGNGPSNYSFLSCSDQTKQYIAGVDNNITYTKCGSLSAHDHALIAGNKNIIYLKESNDSVGIGTTSPGTKLEVYQATNDPTIRVTTGGAGAWLETWDSTSYFSGVKHVGINGSRRWIAGMSQGIESYCIAMSADGSTNRFFTITSSGNVGIGTTSPVNKLHLNGGKFILTSDSGGYGQLQVSAPSGGEATILLGSTGSGENSGTYTNAGVIGIGAYGHARDILVFGTGYSGGTMFLKGGNVGIGNADPNERLRVVATNTTGSDLYPYLNCTNLIDSDFYVSVTGSAATDKRCLIGPTTSTALAFRTGNTERARFSSAGVFTLSNQPAFVAFSTGNEEPSTLSKLNYGNTNINRGSHYNTSTSRFTAPVTGLYSFNARYWIRPGTTGTTFVMLYRNGSAYSETRASIPTATADYTTYFPKWTVYLNAGDYVEIYGYGTGIHTSNSTLYSEFSGYLLG